MTGERRIRYSIEWMSGSTVCPRQNVASHGHVTDIHLALMTRQIGLSNWFHICPYVTSPVLASLNQPANIAYLFRLRRTISPVIVTIFLPTSCTIALTTM